MRQSDSILAGSTFLIGIAAALAGLILLFEASKLFGYFGMRGAPRENETTAGLVVLGLSVLCFFEAYRFCAFSLSPARRDRYYARTLRRSKN